jgi:hypothetical protein
MRTPSDRSNDNDELSPYAPKWARPAATPARHSAESADHAAEPEDLVIGNVRVPPSLASRSLDPTPVPDPRLLRRRLRSRTSRMRIIGRALVASAVAGAAACYWVGVLPSPGRAGTDTPFEVFAALLPGVTSDAPARVELRASERIAKLQERAPASSTAAPVEAPQAAVPVPAPMHTSAPSADPPAAAAELRSTVGAAPAGQFAVAALPATPPPAAAPPAPPTPALRNLDPEEVAMLLRRGEDFVEAGDFVSARPVLQRAAEAGSARAALILAGTFDPAVLQKVNVKGLAPDPAQARRWYEKAIDLGSAEAKSQLARLTASNN